MGKNCVEIPGKLQKVPRQLTCEEKGETQKGLHLHKWGYRKNVTYMDFEKLDIEVWEYGLSDGLDL